MFLESRELKASCDDKCPIQIQFTYDQNLPSATPVKVSINRETKFVNIRVKDEHYSLTREIEAILRELLLGLGGMIETTNIENSLVVD